MGDVEPVLVSLSYPHLPTDISIELTVTHGQWIVYIMCSLEATILWISSNHYLLGSDCGIPSDSSICTSTRKVAMFTSSIKYLFVFMPVGLLLVLAVGSRNHASVIRSTLQIRKDKKRTAIVPDICRLSDVADTLSRAAQKYGNTFVKGRDYQSEADEAHRALIVARDHADAMLRQRRWWHHLFAPS